MRQLLSILLWLFLALAGSGERALAHAALVETVPADGAVLDAAPDHVRLRFNEPVSPLVVRLVDSAGQVHDRLGVTAQNEVLDVAVPPGLLRGTQVLSYRVTSVDGHPIGGSILFSIGQVSTASNATRDQGDPLIRGLIWLARIALYVGLFIGVGGAFFMAWIGAGLSLPSASAILRAALAVGVIGAASSVGLLGLDALGAPLRDLARPQVWIAALQTSFVLTAGAAAAAFLCAYASLLVEERWRRTISMVGLVGVGVALASSGHASSAHPQWLTRTAVFVHGIGVAYWVGALVPLIAVLRTKQSALVVVQRFSRLAVPTVAAVVVAGAVLSVVQVETLSALFTTPYGRVLSAKLVAVAALLGLAALNRIWLTPALTDPKGQAQRRLRLSITVEIALAAVILALVGLWRFTPPPRAMAAAAEPASVHIHGPQVNAEIFLLPGRVGPVRARISLASGGFEPNDPKEVTLVLSRPESGIEPIERPAQKVRRGVWQVENLAVPVAGRWQVQVEILVSDFEQATLEGVIDVRP